MWNIFATFYHFYVWERKGGIDNFHIIEYFTVFFFFSDRNITMDLGYTWIYLQGKIFRQFSLLILTSFIGKFVHPGGR